MTAKMLNEAARALEAEIEERKKKLDSIRAKEAERRAREVQEAEMKRRQALLFWPAGKDLPTVHRVRRRELVPCPNCRRMRLDDTGTAIEPCGTKDAIAYFRCKACGHRFRMKVEEI